MQCHFQQLRGERYKAKALRIVARERQMKGKKDSSQTQILIFKQVFNIPAILIDVIDHFYPQISLGWWYLGQDYNDGLIFYVSMCFYNLRMCMEILCMNVLIARSHER